MDGIRRGRIKGKREEKGDVELEEDGERGGEGRKGRGKGWEWVVV